MLALGMMEVKDADWQADQNPSDMALKVENNCSYSQYQFFHEYQNVIINNV